jgi:hypothetical protein
MKAKALAGIADSSLLMLADILPTGVFAALQAMNHPKVLPALTGRPWPASFFPGDASITVLPEDRVLTFAIIGLGPVGLCACVSLLDMLSSQPLPFQIVAIDPVESRREKAMAVYSKIDTAGKGSGKFVTQSIDDAKETVTTWTGGVGCTAVLEVSVFGNIRVRELTDIRSLETQARYHLHMTLFDLSVQSFQLGYMESHRCPLPADNCTTKMFPSTLGMFSGFSLQSTGLHHVVQALSSARDVPNGIRFIG